jgi:hypothetical protein
MFPVTPYAGRYYAVKTKDDKTTMRWDPCRVVGIDATGEEPQFVIEIRSSDGSYYLDKVDLTRRPTGRLREWSGGVYLGAERRPSQLAKARITNGANLRRSFACVDRTLRSWRPRRGHAL